MIWAIHSSKPKNGHIQFRLCVEIHDAFPSGLRTAITCYEISSLKYFSHVASKVLRPFPTTGLHYP